MTGRPWGLYRTATGWEVAFVHFHDGTPLERFAERSEAVAAREARERAEEREELIRRGQGDLFGESA